MKTFVQPTPVYKTFLQNAEKFTINDKIRNAQVDASAGLAEKLGYSAQQLVRLKTFADQQWLDYDSMYYPDARNYVYVERGGMYLISSWVDDGGNCEKPTDIGALNCYGLDLSKNCVGKRMMP